MTTMAATETAKPTLGTIAKATGLALVVALVVNTVLYFISTAAGWLPVANSFGQEISLVPVLLFTVVPAIAAGVFYFVLTRFLSYANANRWFLIIASLVLIVMALTPITGLTTPTFGAVLMLEIMHLVVGLSIMYYLTKSLQTS